MIWCSLILYMTCRKVLIVMLVMRKNRFLLPRSCWPLISYQIDHDDLDDDGGGNHGDGGDVGGGYDEEEDADVCRPPLMLLLVS